jgi:outer membrane protein assembly factor BamE (lipoprotein component of BamABCDE complex)
MIKKFAIFLIFIALFNSCKINKIVNVHGVYNLKEKVNSLKVKTSNKNDVRNLIGVSLIKDINSENIWSYFEVRETVSKLGKRKILINDMAILSFDNKGILTKIVFRDKDQINKIKFNDEYTTTSGVKDTLMKNVFNSTRKRMKEVQKKYQKN